MQPTEARYTARKRTGSRPGAGGHQATQLEASFAFNLPGDDMASIPSKHAPRSKLKE
jgi:hypothetical protein